VTLASDVDFIQWLLYRILVDNTTSVPVRTVSREHEAFGSGSLPADLALLIALFSYACSLTAAMVWDYRPYASG
jgi:hypothetical protein